jgi:RNA 2',3'-cyclic 3'-phosphodiesterase
MQPLYWTSPNKMNTSESIRTFIAIELPEEVINGLRSLESRLKTSNPSVVKWVDPSSIHLTLKFLGETRLDLFPSITSALDNISKITPPFALSVTELGAFPNTNRVQVVWVGLTGDLSMLNQLQKHIEVSISPLGFPTEKRAFVPHLTLARIRDTASLQDRQNLGALLARTGINTSLKLTVASVSLVQSRLTPAGAIYTNLYTVKLTTSCA